VGNEVTLTAVLRSLPDPLSYLRGVATNMIDWQEKLGPAFLRVGEAAQGLPPVYRIEGSLPDSDPDAPPFRAFNGGTHQRVQWEKQDLRGHLWSSQRASYDEVAGLLREFRGLWPTSKRLGGA
jgi:hypothetical protein